LENEISLQKFEQIDLELEYSKKKNKLEKINEIVKAECVNYALELTAKLTKLKSQNDSLTATLKRTNTESSRLLL